MSKNLAESLNGEQAMPYQQDEVVWVKLGTCWWPAEVQLPDNLPKEIVTSFSKKIPFAVVKFFDEDKYEFVRNSNNITTYMCDRKNDFIRRGLDMHRSKNMYMNKFPADVSMAELRTGGDPDIITSDQFLPGYKKSPPTPKVVLFPSSSTKRSARKRPKRKSVGLSNTSSSSNKMTTTRLFSSKYVCELCDYQTDRLNSIVVHQRYHYTLVGNTDSVAKLKIDVAKKRSKSKPLSIAKVSKTSGVQSDDDSFIEMKNESLSDKRSHKRQFDVVQHSAAKKVKRSSTRSSKKPVVEPQRPLVEDLVREWDMDESMQVDEDEEDFKDETEFESEIVTLMTDVKDDDAADSGVSTEEVQVEPKLRPFQDLCGDDDDDQEEDRQVLDKFDKLMDETKVKFPPVLTGNQKYLKRTRQQVRITSRSRSNQEPEDFERSIVATEPQLKVEDKVDTESEVLEQTKKEFEPEPEPEPTVDLESADDETSKLNKPSTSESVLSVSPDQVDQELDDSRSVAVKPKLRTSKRPLKLDESSKSVSEEKDNSLKNGEATTEKIATSEPRLRTSRRSNEHVTETVRPSNKSEQTLSTSDNNVVTFEAPRLRSSKRLSTFLIENEAKKPNQNQETNAFVGTNSSISVEETITPKLRTSKRIRKVEDVATTVVPESEPLEVESNVAVECDPNEPEIDVANQTIPQLRVSKRNLKKSNIKAVVQPTVDAVTHLEPEGDDEDVAVADNVADQEITENLPSVPESHIARLRSGKRRSNTAVKRPLVDEVNTSSEAVKVFKPQPEEDVKSANNRLEPERDQSLSISSTTLDSNKVTTRSAKKLESNKDVTGQVEDVKSVNNAIESKTEESSDPQTPPVLESYKVSTRSAKKAKIKAKEQFAVTEATSLEPKEDVKAQFDDTDNKVELEPKPSIACDLAQNKARKRSGKKVSTKVMEQPIAIVSELEGEADSKSKPQLEDVNITTDKEKISSTHMIDSNKDGDIDTEVTSLEPEEEPKTPLEEHVNIIDNMMDQEIAESETAPVLDLDKADEPSTNECGTKADEDFVLLELNEEPDMPAADDGTITDKIDELEANGSRKTPSPNKEPNILKPESEMKENCCEIDNTIAEKIDLDEVNDKESSVQQLMSDVIEPEKSAIDQVSVPESITTEVISVPEIEQKPTESETAVVEQVTNEGSEIKNEIVQKARVQLPPPPLTPFSKHIKKRLGVTSNASKIEKSSQIDKFNFSIDYVDAKEADHQSSEVINGLPILEREPSVVVDESSSVLNSNTEPETSAPDVPKSSLISAEIATTSSQSSSQEIARSGTPSPPLPVEDPDQSTSSDQRSVEKPKIVIDKVITASGTIVDAKSYDFNSSANDSQMLDINSMPLVVSDLNTSNCATGSSTTIISVPIANTLASSSNLHMPTTSSTVSLASAPAPSTTITYTTVVATNAKNVFSSRIPVFGHKTVPGQRTPKIYKDVSNKNSNKTVLLTQSGKPGQFVIVPSTRATSTGSKYTVGKNRPIQQKVIATNSPLMLVKASSAPRQIMMKTTPNMSTPTIITEDGKIVSLQNATVQSAASISSNQKAILMHNQVLCNVSKGQSNSVVVQTLPKKQIVKQVTMVKRTNMPGTFKMQSQSQPEQTQVRQQRIVKSAETSSSHVTVSNPNIGQTNQTLRYVINDYLGNKIELHEGQIIAYPYEVKADEVPAFYIFKVENCNLVPLPDDVMKSMEEYIKKTVPGRILSSNQIVKMPTVIQEIVPSDEKPEGQQAPIPCNGQPMSIDERVLITDDGKKLIYTEHGYIEATDDMDIDEFLLRTKDNVRTAAVDTQIPDPIPVPVVEEEEIIFDENQFIVMNRSNNPNVDHQQVPPKDIIAVALAGSDIFTPTVPANSSKHIDTTSTSLTITGPIMATEETKSSSTTISTLDNCEIEENNVNSAAESMLAMSMPLLDLTEKNDC